MSNSEPLVSLIFGFRNRDSVRVRRCLDSLSKQSVKDFSVCFVDYGSDDYVSTEIKKAVEAYTFCKYVYAPTVGKFWNRAHALNIGVRESGTSEFVLTTDVDIIFPPNFIEKLHDVLHKDKEIHFSARDLPEDFKRWKDLHKGKLFGETRPNTALGLAQAVHRAKFETIGGFDEFYCIWGVEDEDLSERLSLTGVKTEWIDLDDCILYHQWHPTSGRRNFNLPGRWQEFLVNYKNKNRAIKRNNENWGRINFDRVINLTIKSSEDSQYELNDVPAQMVTFQMEKVVSKMSAGEIAKFVYIDHLFDQLNQSRLIRVIRKINGFLDKRDSGLMLTNDLNYYRKYQSVYDYRDAVAYFILYNRALFQDYYLVVSEHNLQIVIMK